MTRESADWTYIPTPTPETLADALDVFVAQDGAAAGVLALVCEGPADVAAVPVLQQVANERNVALCGAIVPGVVTADAVRRTGVLLGRCDRSRPRAIVPLPSQDGHTLEEAGDALIAFAATAANPVGGDMLLLLMDVRVPDSASVIDRLYLEIGDSVTYAGMSVGSETFTSEPCLFDNTQFLSDAVLAVVVPAHPGATLAHHYSGNEALWVATVAKGGHINTIDGRPAFEVYQDLMARDYGITIDRENFYQYSVHYPFALNRAHGEALVRIPVKVEEDGSVYCSGEIRENSLVSIVRAVSPGELTAAIEVGRGAGAHGADSVLLFYCAGRFLHLGEEAAGLELDAIRQSVEPAPVYGALCLGEIGALKHQYPAFHNCTLTALPWI
ncbi:MAG: FIST signal transduction protein [Vicinamibacterales bacterium]